MASGSSTLAGASMPPVLVTGSAGHVGANLVRRLLDDGALVRVLLRHEDNNEALEGLDVERSFGDIRDLNAARRAAGGLSGRLSLRGQRLDHRRRPCSSPGSVREQCSRYPQRAAGGAGGASGPGGGDGLLQCSRVRPGRSVGSQRRDDAVLSHGAHDALRAQQVARRAGVLARRGGGTGRRGRNVLRGGGGRRLSCPRAWEGRCATTPTASFMPMSMAVSSLSRRGTSSKDTCCACTVDVRARSTSSAPSTRQSPRCWICSRRFRAFRGRVGGFRPA